MNYNNVLRFGFILAKTPSFIFAKKFEIVKKTNEFISYDEKYTEILLQLKKLEFKYNLSFGS
jgi:hypothetical protein